MALIPYDINTAPYMPPPRESLTREDGTEAIGWRYVSKPMNPGATRWIPEAWEIVFPDSILSVSYSSHLATRDSALYALPVSDN